MYFSNVLSVQFSLFCNEWTEWKAVASCASWQMLQKDITLLLSSAVPKQPFNSRKHWYVLLTRAGFVWIPDTSLQRHDQHNQPWARGRCDASLWACGIRTSWVPAASASPRGRPTALASRAALSKWDGQRSPRCKGKGESNMVQEFKENILSSEEHDTRCGTDLLWKVRKRSRPSCTNKAAIQEVLLLTGRNPLMNPKQFLGVLRNSIIFIASSKAKSYILVSIISVAPRSHSYTQIPKRDMQ